MNSRSITAIALKIVALYLFYTAVICFPAWMVFTMKMITSKFLAVMAIMVGIIGGTVIAILVWKLSVSLARDIKTDAQETVHTEITLLQLEELFIRFFGLYVFVTNLRPAFDNLLGLFYALPSGAVYNRRPTQIAALIHFVLIGFSLSFFLKPKYWQKKLSFPGVNQSEQEQLKE